MRKGGDRGRELKLKSQCRLPRLSRNFSKLEEDVQITTPKKRKRERESNELGRRVSRLKKRKDKKGRICPIELSSGGPGYIPPGASSCSVGAQRKETQKRIPSLRLLWARRAERGCTGNGDSEEKRENGTEWVSVTTEQLCVQRNRKLHLRVQKAEKEASI